MLLASPVSHADSSRPAVGDGPVEAAPILSRAAALLIDTAIVTGLQKLIFAITSTAVSGLRGLILGCGILLLAWIFYFGIGVSRWRGRTPGKYLLRIRIVDVRSADGSIDPWTALSREFYGRLASTCLFGIGYLIAFFGPERLALHDRILGTRVIKVVRE